MQKYFTVEYHRDNGRFVVRETFLGPHESSDPTLETRAEAEQEALRLNTMPPQTTARLASYPYRPCNEKTVEIVIEFGEHGWKVIKDTRDVNNSWSKASGYLHWYADLSAPHITDEVRDQIAKYFFDHPDNLPSIGATPQQHYFRGMDISDLERIGNHSVRGYYA